MTNFQEPKMQEATTNENGNDNTQRPPGDWQSPAEDPTQSPKRPNTEKSPSESPSSTEDESDEERSWDGSDSGASDLRVELPQLL